MTVKAYGLYAVVKVEELSRGIQLFCIKYFRGHHTNTQHVNNSCNLFLELFMDKTQQTVILYAFHYFYTVIMEAYLLYEVVLQ